MSVDPHPGCARPPLHLTLEDVIEVEPPDGAGDHQAKAGCPDGGLKEDVRGGLSLGSLMYHLAPVVALLSCRNVGSRMSCHSGDAMNMNRTIELCDPIAWMPRLRKELVQC